MPPASTTMMPNVSDSSTSSTECLVPRTDVQSGEDLLGDVKKKLSESKSEKQEPYRVRLVWRNIIAFIYLHGGALYGIYLLAFYAQLITFVWAYGVASLAGMGITAGAHRLWSHRAYKAKWQLRLILATLQTMAFQNCIYEWTRDHRVHHKFSETDADPHNANRGFFFSHIGWLLCRKHPDVYRKGVTVDMSDLDQDPIVVWQRRLYLLVMPLLAFVFPVWVPCYFWNETLWHSWYIAGVLRYVLSLNFTWLVNSAAHIWGTKPFDNTISPTENMTVAIAAFGEGWHNYHHVFPWDYKAAELGNYRFNVSTAFIDFFAKIGWAYDLKSVPAELVHRRAARTGDGSYERQKDDSEPANSHHVREETPIWGWGDKDMPAEDSMLALRSFSSERER